MPTFTWQAYNFEDENGDGWGDSWYVSWDQRATVRLGRHYLGRGIPPHFRQYDLNFLHWLTWRNRGVDYLADSDIASGTNAATLAQAYDLILSSFSRDGAISREGMENVLALDKEEGAIPEHVQFEDVADPRPIQDVHRALGLVR